MPENINNQTDPGGKMLEFEIDGKSYRANKLNAFKQLHIVRRLTPCVAGLAGFADFKLKIIKDEEGKILGVDGDMGAALEPLVKAIAGLKDEDVEYIFNACLEVVERKQGNGWSFVRLNDATMFDLSLPELLQISARVIMDNLAGFMNVQSSLSGMEEFLRAKGFLG